MSQPDLTTLAAVKQWLQISGAAITAITAANPAVVTIAGQVQPPLVTGMEMTISGTGIIDGAQIITVKSANTFSVPVDTTLSPPYVYGGVAGVSDSLLQRLIDAASAFIYSLITRNIFSQDYVETRNGLGGTMMMLKQTPVTNVAALAVDGLSIALRPPLTQNQTTQNGYGGYFVFDDRRVMLTGGYQFCRGMQNIVINYTAGFVGVPADLEQACIDMIGDWFKYKDRIGKASEGIEQQTIAFTKADVPGRAMRIINTYNSVAPIY